MDRLVAPVLHEANRLSIVANKEYGGLVYEDKDGNVHVTPPQEGSLNGFNPSAVTIPDGAKVIGDYHTHGNYSDTKGNLVSPDKDEFNSLNFSRGDYRGITNDGKGNPDYAGYLGTPNGTLKRYQPSTRQETIYNPKTQTFE